MKPFMLSVLLASSLVAGLTHAADEEAAKALAKRSDCMKCHAVDKEKKGPSYKKVAEKYRGKADAEQKLLKHITTGPMVKIDGEQEEHRVVESKDPAELKNLVQWILAQ